MNVLQRIGMTAQATRHAWQSSAKLARQRRQRANSVLLWPDWRNEQAKWNITDLTSYIEEGYSLNSIIYSAVMYKVRAAYPAVLRAYTGTRDEPELLPAGSELGALLDRPNRFQSFPELQAEMYTHFNLFGNAYIWYRRQRGKEYPVSFYNVRPDRVMHLYEKKKRGEQRGLKGYLFVPVGMSPADGVPLLVEDTMHVRLPNPGDPFLGLGKGMSPIKPLARSGDVDNAATEFLKVFFDQGTMPMGMISVDVPLDDETIAEARERWLQQYGNWTNWIEPIIMGQGAEYHRLSASFDELDLEALDARNESRIAMPFGVPLTLIESRPGLVQSTYSNKETDHRMFITNVLTAELSMFGEEWRYFLRSEDGGEFAQYDLTAVPGYIDQMAQIQNLADAWSNGGATRAEYRKALGLPVSEVDNVFMIGFTSQLIPADGPVQAAPQSESGAAQAQDEEEEEKAIERKQADTRKLALHNQINQVAVGAEAQALTASQEAFRKDQREILRIINQAQKSAYTERKSVNWSLVLLAVSEYLNNASLASWREIFDPVLAGVVTAQGQSLADIFDQPFEPSNFLSQDWFLSYRMVFVDPIADTSEREMAELFRAAMAEGWSVPRMSDNLGLLFEQWIEGTASDTLAGMSEEELQRYWFAVNRLPPWRAILIARTEMLRASNATSYNIYKDWGVAMKEWFSTPDARTRPTHQVGAAFGQDPLVVPIDEPFEIGGARLMFPGDPSGPLEEFIQCRCTVLPVM